MNAFDLESAFLEVSNPAYDVVSFDVFDTLLRRRVMDPNHVFWLMESVLLSRGHDFRWVRHLGHARIHSWHRAVRRAQLQGRQDTCLDGIYEVLSCVLPEARPHIDEIKRVELECERTLLEVYPVGQKLFEKAKASGKRVVLCSDQYLPKTFLEECLRSSGIDGYEQFFLSGELGVLKITGTLYDWMALRLGVYRQRMLHVGDTEDADIVMSRRAGLHALKIPKSVDYAHSEYKKSAVCRQPSLASVASAMFLHQRADQALLNGARAEKYSVEDAVDFYGYALLGPLLVGLSRWLAEKKTSQKLDKLWFLSRDGEGLAKVFALLYPGLSVDARYVYASRRLIVYNSDQLSVAEIFRHYRHLDKPDCRVHDFLRTLFAPSTELDALCGIFTSDATLGQPSVRDKLVSELGIFIKAGHLTHTLQAANVRKYYQEQLEGVKRLGVFDVGWRANLQRGLQKLLCEDNVDVFGFYMGHIFESEVGKSLVNAESFAFDFDFPGEVFADLTSCLWIIEHLFTSTHRSVVGVEEANGQYVPQYEEASSDKDTQCALGSRLQRSALRFVDDVLKWDRELVLAFAERDFLVRALRDFVARPSEVDGLSFVGHKVFVDVDEKSGRPLVATPLSLKQYRSRLHSKMDEKSLWVAGYHALIRAEKTPLTMLVLLKMRCKKHFPLLWRTLRVLKKGLRRCL